MWLNTTDPKLVQRIAAFVLHVDKVIADYWVKANYTHSKPTHIAEYISEKWVRIMRVENGTPRSVYAFVALKDNETKQLGKVKTGDIHKPASLKGPAKHARGSVFVEDFNNCAGPYSIQYLSGPDDRCDGVVDVTWPIFTKENCDVFDCCSCLRA